GVYSGVYCNQFVEGLRPVAYRQLGPNLPVESLTWKEATEAADERGITQVDAAGAGFLCIPRQCLQAVGEKFVSSTPWFAEIALGEDHYTGTHFGEDLTFCLRAAHVGWPTYLATTLVASHYKTCAIKPEES